jgi:short-subunit dehydrogenase
VSQQPRPLAAITGASSGIGKVFAQKLAPTHDLLLIARRRDRLESLAAELTPVCGCEVFILEADLTIEDDLARVADRIAGAPQLALCVNNAGFGLRGLFLRSDLRQLEQMHRLNISAVLRLSHAALCNMVARGSGALINVASVAGFVRRARNVGYGATKAWVVAFTESLYLDMQAMQSPVRIQALCPGYTYSEFHDHMNIDRMRIASRAMWLPAEFVVEKSLKALESGRLFVVPGWRYRLIVNLSSTLPIPLRLALERMTARRRRSAASTVRA